MNKNLDEQLVKDFPNLYADRHADMSVTCMVWGFPGDGWHDLIRKASAIIESEILKMPEEERPKYKALTGKGEVWNSSLLHDSRDTRDDRSY